MSRPTPETDDLARGNHVVPTEWAEQLEIERNEAIRQRDETNESSVFTCNFYYEEKLKAERERDEARDDAEHWKIEWEIVEARLCGWKHPRDNGIIFEHEVIPRLKAKIAQLEGKTAKPEPSWYNQREIPIANEEETK